MTATGPIWSLAHEAAKGWPTQSVAKNARSENPRPRAVKRDPSSSFLPPHPVAPPPRSPMASRTSPPPVSCSLQHPRPAPSLALCRCTLGSHGGWPRGGGNPLVLLRLHWQPWWLIMRRRRKPSCAALPPLSLVRFHRAASLFRLPCAALRLTLPTEKESSRTTPRWGGAARHRWVLSSSFPHLPIVPWAPPSTSRFSIYFSLYMQLGWGLVPTPMTALASSGTSLDFRNLAHWVWGCLHNCSLSLHPSLISCFRFKWFFPVEERVVDICCMLSRSVFPPFVHFEKIAYMVFMCR